MNNTTKRILTSIVMIAIIGAAAYFGFIRYLTIAIAVIMGLEILHGKIKAKARWPLWANFGFFSYWIIFIISAYFAGAKPWVMLLLFMIIAATDTGAWFFGKNFGGDKLWPSVSPGKTWSGHIAGLICGTFAGIMYGLLGTDVFLASLMWIGIGVATLSQYGDLAASWMKRKIGIKDFANTLPGHGGFADRFDGWIFVLPIIWLALTIR